MVISSWLSETFMKKPFCGHVMKSDQIEAQGKPLCLNTMEKVLTFHLIYTSLLLNPLPSLHLKERRGLIKDSRTVDCECEGGRARKNLKLPLNVGMIIDGRRRFRVRRAAALWGFGFELARAHLESPTKPVQQIVF